jgi:hypothetical protein
MDEDVDIDSIGPSSSLSTEISQRESAVNLSGHILWAHCFTVRKDQKEFECT